MKDLILLSPLALIPKLASAHCPLCTVGAGALAVAAASLGISIAAVGVFIGAFALALGLWLAKMIKKEYFKYQGPVITALIFFSTIIPIMPLIREYRPLYISLAGEYGTVFHNTYMINLFVSGSVIGAALLFVSPYISKVVTRARGGKTSPYQGLNITFALIILAAAVLQLTI